MKKIKLAKFLLWFLALSCFGVGGGIFFLLFAVVPIEQWYVDRGWSQYKIDQVMKYYVFGWIIFGVCMSLIYYYLLVNKNRWIGSILTCLSTIVLCAVGLYYFFNTQSSIVQASQGEVEVGQRFTFGPYPEKKDLQRLKEDGYDGVIALLSDVLPIEKPLIEQLKNDGEEIGIEIISMPMLPWVGDNTETLNNIRQLIEKDEKKYYVHCYLGRHRVDVVKQLVASYSEDDITILFIQPTSLERGHLFFDAKKNILVGPYPTNEEWFTRIRRGEVEEVISLIGDTNNQTLLSNEEKIVKELDMNYVHAPIGKDYTLEDLKQIYNKVIHGGKKTYIHRFSYDFVLQELETLIRNNKTIFPLQKAVHLKANVKNVSGKYLIGPPLSEVEKRTFQQLGVEKFALVEKSSIKDIYNDLLQFSKESNLFYIQVKDEGLLELTTQLLNSIHYGFADYKEAKLNQIMGENSVIYQRNLTVGPIVEGEELEQLLVTNGISYILYVQYPSISQSTSLEPLNQLKSQYNVNIDTIVYGKNFDNDLVEKLNSIQTSVYVMVDEELLQEVIELVHKY